MKRSEAAERRVEEYLGAVERHLAHRPEGERREIVSGLRDHITEARRRAGERGDEESDTVERILADMDPPESFSEAAVDMAPGGAAGGGAPNRGGSGRWFALALAFLLVNAYGVWRWTDYLERREAAETAAPETQPVRKAERILRLRKVEQVDVSPDRRLILRLMFSDEPDRNKLTRFLRLNAPGEGPLDYRLMEAMVEGKVGDHAWLQAKARMDQLVRNG